MIIKIKIFTSFKLVSPWARFFCKNCDIFDKNRQMVLTRGHKSFKLA